MLLLQQLLVVVVVVLQPPTLLRRRFVYVIPLHSLDWPEFSLCQQQQQQQHCSGLCSDGYCCCRCLPLLLTYLRLVLTTKTTRLKIWTLDSVW